MTSGSQKSFFSAQLESRSLCRATKPRLCQLGSQATPSADSLRSTFRAKYLPNRNPVLKEKKGGELTFKDTFRFRMCLQTAWQFGAPIYQGKLAPLTSTINADTAIFSIELWDQYNCKAKTHCMELANLEKIKLQNTWRCYFRVKMNFLIPCRF